MIDVLIDGVRYGDFTRVTFTDSAENLCNQFSISCTAKDGFKFPIRRGLPCEIHIDGNKIFTGAVEKIKGSYSFDAYSISFDGRDKTKEILKQHLPPGFNLKGPIALKSVIEKALKIGRASCRERV